MVSYQLWREIVSDSSSWLAYGFFFVEWRVAFLTQWVGSGSAVWRDTGWLVGWLFTTPRVGLNCRELEKFFGFLFMPGFW